MRLRHYPVWRSRSVPLSRFDLRFESFLAIDVDLIIVAELTIRLRLLRGPRIAGIVALTGDSERPSARGVNKVDGPNYREFFRQALALVFLENPIHWAASQKINPLTFARWVPGFRRQIFGKLLKGIGRGEWIRTTDLLVPNQEPTNFQRLSDIAHNC